MRISTAHAHDQAIETLMKRQVELTDLQDQLTTGKRVAKASDDPAAAARAERALAGVLRADTSQRAVEASRTVMSQTESAMSDAEDLLQEAREGLVAAGNASYSDQERAGLAAKLRAIREQLLSVANRTDGAGTYLFGGQSASAVPFADQPGGVAYQGLTGEVRTEGGTDLPLSADGSSVFMSARTGNGVYVTSAAAGVTGAWIDNGQVSDPGALTGANYTIQFSVSGAGTTYAVLQNGNPTAITAAPYTSGQDIAVDGMTFKISGVPANGDQFTIAPSTPTLSVFDTLDRAINQLSTPGRSAAQIAQGNTDALRDIDQSMGQMQRARAVAGEVLARIEHETSRLDTQKLANQTERSRAEDLDMTQAISEFQNRQTGYDAALKSYSMVQRLSLFQYLNS
ncbi:flagellar hook-associated protein FlgL [Piscinibacter defluvii]|uniref:flagellar hook-associated protein FlgL n=1 Tax=Piscinibacter defluvii TaxID=1796922 RepID=UPI000FDDCA3A|nr:flagellar hook-associated protein FlgL [Piscinibacter defluvii]